MLVIFGCSSAFCNNYCSVLHDGFLLLSGAHGSKSWLPKNMTQFPLVSVKSRPTKADPGIVNVVKLLLLRQIVLWKNILPYLSTAREGHTTRLHSVRRTVKMLIQLPVMIWEASTTLQTFLYSIDGILEVRVVSVSYDHIVCRFFDFTTSLRM